MNTAEEPIIGRIEWEATNCRSGQVIDQGVCEVRSAEVLIEWIGVGIPAPQVARSFYLSSEFVFGLCHKPTNEEPQGFAFQCDREGANTFSWEWFCVDAPGHAKKIQESGEVGFSIREGSAIPDLMRTEFLTDVSIRVVRFGIFAKPLDPDWRLKIFKGSWVEWPDPGPPPAKQVKEEPRGILDDHPRLFHFMMRAVTMPVLGVFAVQRWISSLRPRGPRHH